jgi:hypothetical protein
MRYVWVNARVEPMKVLCAFDHVALGQGELSTGLVYQNRCYLEMQWLECEKAVSHAKAS